jgi:hypothetical protein
MKREEDGGDSEEPDVEGAYPEIEEVAADQGATPTRYFSQS